MKRFYILLLALGFLSQEADAGRFDIGVASYSFRKLTVFEAIEKTRESGGDVIEFFLWQKLSPEKPDVILNQNLSEENLAELKAKLDKCGVRAVNAYFNNEIFKDEPNAETRLRKLFEFARKLGLTGLTGEPPLDKLDLVEKMVKEFNIKFCFHNHPKDPQRPEYLNWNPEYLVSLMDGRDQRMGFSLDTGHISRSGLNNIVAVRLYGKRLNSVHLKDVEKAGKESIDLRYGAGISDIAGILAELKRHDFNGHVAVEYENITDQLMDDVRYCINYIRERSD